MLRGADEVNGEVVVPGRRRSEEGAQEVGDVTTVLGALMAQYGEVYDGRANACTGAAAAGGIVPSGDGRYRQVTRECPVRSTWRGEYHGERRRSGYDGVRRATRGQ